MNRLLVATDLTEGSAHALGRGLRLATKSGAALRIIHAAPRSASGGHSYLTRKTLLAQVAQLSGALAGREVDVSIRIRSASPAAAILAEAERFDADLVLLGGHGEPRRRDAILGTTATRLVRSGRPVLVVQTDDGRPYTKVMAALDDSLTAESVLDLAFRAAPDAEIFAIHAFDTPSDEPKGAGVPEDLSADRQCVLELMVARLASKTGFSADKAHAIAREGDVTRVLSACWTEIQPDLLVLGTRGRTGAARLIHGSFADFFLLHCPSDLLVIRLPSDAALSMETRALVAPVHA